MCLTQVFKQVSSKATTISDFIFYKIYLFMLTVQGKDMVICLNATKCALKSLLYPVSIASRGVLQSS